MSATPTVRIKSDAPGHQPEGFVLVNESDFDPKVHQLFEPPSTDPDKQSKAGKAAKKE